MKKIKFFSLAVALAALFAANAFAQGNDTAYVPFTVNVDATATAKLGNAVKATQALRAGYTDTLHIIVDAEITPTARPGIAQNPVVMHNSRGKISLELSRAFGSTDIALYSLNGKQIMHGKAAASDASISHRDIKTGVYLLSVKGAGGNAFTTRFAHSGGGLNINVAFSNGGSASLLERTIPGNWTITVSAEGYLDTSYAFIPETGIGNTPVQVITLRQDGGSSSSSDDGGSSSSSGCVHGTEGSVPHEGKTYKTICIGEQNWFAENLNYEASGSKCSGEGGLSFYGGGPGVTITDEEVQTNCEKYGRLYTWATAMALDPSCNSASCAGDIEPKHQGVCPDGWHLPSMPDWDELLHFVDDENDGDGDVYNSDEDGYGYDSNTAGDHLKAASGWTDRPINQQQPDRFGYNGYDTYGFTALPGGQGFVNGNFNYEGIYAYWWTATEWPISASWPVPRAYSRLMYTNDHIAFWHNPTKVEFLSVRCVQN